MDMTEEKRKKKKDGKWQFLVRQPNDQRNIKTRYDSSDFADEFVSFLKKF